MNSLGRLEKLGKKIEARKEKEGTQGLKEATEIFTMEDFRRLGMGLQGQIDTKVGSVTAETPSGTIDSSNKDFTITTTKLIALYLNGVYQTGGGTDYTLSGTTITYVSAPPTGSGHQAVVYS